MKKILTLTMTALLGLSSVAWGQESSAGALAPVENPWYIGAGGGTSFGQCTFYSITEDGIRSWGLQGGLFGGYKFNRLISIEAGFQYGGQSQFNLDCCPYWLSTDGVWKATRVLDKDGWYFDDMEAATRWFKFAVQGNFNLLSFIRSNEHWSLDLSPQISLVNTQSTWKGNLSQSGNYHEEAQPAAWHLGLGGQIGAGYAITPNWKAGIYGGIIALTGERFDRIPNNYHKTNLIWDAGIKVTYTFGKNKKKSAPAIVEVPATVVPVAEKVEEPEVAPAEEPKPVVEEPVAEPVQEIVAEPAPKCYQGSFPIIYFADCSFKLGEEAEKLKEVASILAEYPDTEIALDGYASPYGAPGYNAVLVDKRLEKVKDYLTGLGVDESRIGRMTNHGIDHSVKLSRDGRRVEISIIEK